MSRLNIVLATNFEASLNKHLLDMRLVPNDNPFERASSDRKNLYINTDILVGKISSQSTEEATNIIQ